MLNRHFLQDEPPLDALCHHFSLAKAVFPLSTPLAPTFSVHLISPAIRLPTHVLAIFPPEDSAIPNAPPLMVPIDASMYHGAFENAGAVPHPGLAAVATPQHITLPVVSVHAPHIHSVPLLFLFGLGLETDRNQLAARVLPPEVIGEFPNAAAMAGVLSRLPEAQFDWYLDYVRGLWKNVLAFAPRDAKLVDFVQLVYKVVADARRLRR